MKFYMAPMEGITGYVYRNAYNKHYNNIDKYFTPFITNKKLSNKELNDILPEHNKNMKVVPQILTNKAEDFLAIAEELRSYAYEEVNLNLGCPSGTVVSKYKGSGFLKLPNELDSFLEEIFSRCSLKISIKTRIGYEDREEWNKLLSIYNKYPVEELIIHPRLRSDFYNNTPDMEAFSYAAQNSNSTLCYNGDIYTSSRFEDIANAYPDLDRIMLGRGILRNPELISCINKNAEYDIDKFKEFHSDILEGYKEIMSGERNTLFKMKELWHYMGTNFTNPDKYMKKIKKANRLTDYETAVNSLLKEQEIKE